MVASAACNMERAVFMSIMSCKVSAQDRRGDGTAQILGAGTAPVGLERSGGRLATADEDRARLGRPVVSEDSTEDQHNGVEAGRLL